MPFTEQEKNNLVNDGKFTIEQVNYYDSTGISYDKIKELQSVLVDDDRINGGDSSLSRINEEVDDLIRVTFSIINRTINLGRPISMDQMISDSINDIRGSTQRLAANGIDNVSESSDSMVASRMSDSSEENIGGKRRRKRKNRKSKRKKSKRLGKRGRKTRKYVKV
jgi:hypothetical protein